MLVAHCAVGGGDKPRLTVLPGAEGVLQLHIRTPGWREGQGVSFLVAGELLRIEVFPFHHGFQTAQEAVTDVRLDPVADHPALRVIIRLQALGVGRSGVQVDVVGEIVHVGVQPDIERFVVPVDSCIELVGFFGRQTGFSLFITEDVVIYPVGAQLFRDGHAEAFPDVRFPYPCSSGVVDAQRPGEAVERPPKPCRPLPIDGIASGNRRLVPVVITVDASYDPVDTDASVQN